MQKRQLVKGTQGPKKTQMDRQALTHGYMRDLQAASQWNGHNFYLKILTRSTLKV